MPTHLLFITNLMKNKNLCTEFLSFNSNVFWKTLELKQYLVTFSSTKPNSFQWLNVWTSELFSRGTHNCMYNFSDNYPVKWNRPHISWAPLKSCANVPQQVLNRLINSKTLLIRLTLIYFEWVWQISATIHLWITTVKRV